MKRTIFAAILALVLCVPALAERVYLDRGEAFYHIQEDCDFAVVQDGKSYPDRYAYANEDEAKARRARPCPACASEWAPTFTGEFPAWEHACSPWSLGRVDTYLPHTVRKEWGDAAAAIRKLCPDGPDGEEPKYPDSFGGVFVNACGGYTILMVEPTDERVEKYREQLGCDFWVLEAAYSMNELNKLRGTVSDNLLTGFDSELKVFTCGLDVVLNRVDVGTSDMSEENVGAIRAALFDLGCEDLGMVWIHEVVDPSTVDPNF